MKVNVVSVIMCSAILHLYKIVIFFLFLFCSLLFSTMTMDTDAPYIFLNNIVKSRPILTIIWLTTSRNNLTSEI